MIPDKLFYGAPRAVEFSTISNDEGLSIFRKGALSSISAIASLNEAKENELCFVENEDTKLPAKINAGAIIIPEALSEVIVKKCLPSTAILISKTPYQEFTKLVRLIYPLQPDIQEVPPVIGANCHIAKTAIIKAGTNIGANSIIGDFTVVGGGCSIGANTTIGNNVSITYCHIGNNCQISDGARLGFEGFGFRQSENGITSMPHLGRVIIADNVNIGNNSCIDRGTMLDTVIGEGTRIDNLVHIAHGVKMGKQCIICALVGIAGSTTLGNNVIVAAQAGIKDHLTIADNTVIMARSGVTKNTEAGTVLSGMPAMKANEWNRFQSKLRILTRDNK